MLNTFKINPVDFKQETKTCQFNMTREKKYILSNRQITSKKKKEGFFPLFFFSENFSFCKVGVLYIFNRKRKRTT